MGVFILMLFLVVNDEEQYVPKWVTTRSHPLLPPSLYYMGVGIVSQSQNAKKDIERVKKNGIEDIKRCIYDEIVLSLKEKGNWLSLFILNFVPNRIEGLASSIAKKAKIDEIRLDKRHHLYYALIELDKRKLSMDLSNEINNLYDKAIRKINLLTIHKEKGKNVEEVKILLKLIIEICDIWIKNCLLERLKNNFPPDEKGIHKIRIYKISEIEKLLNKIIYK